MKVEDVVHGHEVGREAQMLLIGLSDGDRVRRLLKYTFAERVAWGPHITVR